MTKLEDTLENKILENYNFSFEDKEKIKKNNKKLENNNKKTENNDIFLEKSKNFIETDQKYIINKNMNVNQEKKPKNNKEYKNSYIYGFIFIIMSVLLEICNFLRLGLGLLPVNFGIEFSIILMLAGIIFIIPTEVFKIILTSVFFGVQFIINLVNASLYKTISDLLTLDMIFTISNEGANAFEINHIDFISLFLHIIVLILFILAIIFSNKYAPKYKLKKGKRVIVCLLALLFSIELIGYSSFTAFKYGYFQATVNAEYVFEDNEYLYNTSNLKFTTLKKYGFWSFYINDIKNLFYNKIDKDKYKQLDEYVKSGENYKNTNSSYTFINNNEIKTKSVSEILKNDNLIIIMMESAEWFAIDPYNTPNLYNLIEKNSIKFSNFYASNKTNVSEQISLLGNSLNSTSLKTLNNNIGINTPNSLPNLFKNNGYNSVNFFHSYLGNFYFRNTINKEIGFDNIYSIEDYPNNFSSNGFGDFIDDGEFINAFKEKFMPNNKKFFSYFTTVTTHGPYTKSNDRYKHYYEIFEQNYDNYLTWVNKADLNYKIPEKQTEEYNIFKEYKSRAMALENTISVILNHLNNTKDQNNNLLIDNTSIIMFSDHNAYYTDLSSKIKNIDKNNIVEQYNIPFVIFNKKLPSTNINTFCSTFDIYPTICDLYGFNYNKNLVSGYSVFSNDIKNSVFISSKSGIFDSNYYTVTLDKFIASNNTIETNSKLINFKQNIDKFLTKQDYIETYYRINYEEYVN